MTYQVVWQDGYALVAADGPKEYEVAFEALAGTTQETLQPGSVAYIGTGAAAEDPMSCMTNY